MRRTRRNFLAGAGLLLSGGAVTSVVGQSSDAADVTAITDTLPRVAVDGRFRLSRDSRKSWRIDAESDALVQMDLVVRWGPPVDVLLFNEAVEYRAYLNDYRARYHEDGSFFNVLDIDPTEGEGAVTVPSGEHFVVLDNTDYDGGFPQIPDVTTDWEGYPPQPENDASSGGLGEVEVDFDVTVTQ
ncbi:MULTISPECIES: hypothetical protein [Salinibaculum]|uniref:hypothetical protein n=1 Tax=Salinibaculum TaxID=2732368 RepID=UPI0030CDB18B